MGLQQRKELKMHLALTVQRRVEDEGGIRSFPSSVGGRY